MPDPIRQPRNKRVSIKIKQMKAEADLAWKQTFGKEQKARFDNVQKFVDSECIRLMAKYTPARNNILYKSATIGAKIGSGHIYYQSPYARFQYYGKVMVSSVTGSPYARHGEKKVLTDRDLVYSTARHPQAQAKWFEMTKQRHKKQILRGVAAITGGKT